MSSVLWVAYRVFPFRLLRLLLPFVLHVGRVAVHRSGVIRLIGLIFHLIVKVAPYHCSSVGQLPVYLVLRLVR